MSLKKVLVLSSLFFLCLFISEGLKAQSHIALIDSLLSKGGEIYSKDAVVGKTIVEKAYHLAKNNNLPAKQIKALELLAYFAYNERQYDRGYAFADSAIKIGKLAKIDSLTGDALVTLGSIQSGNHLYNKALISFQQALNYYHGPGMIGRTATAYLNMGVCERKLGRFEKASKFYIKAAEGYRQLHDEASLAEAYNAIGNCFTSANNYDKGIFYHQQALLLREKRNDQTAIAQSCNNLGHVFWLAKQPDAAIKYLSRALAIRQLDQDSSKLTLTLQNLGAAWKMKNDLPKAKAFISRSLKIAAHYHMDEELARGNLDMAELLLNEGQTKVALSYADKAGLVAKQLRIPELLMNVHGLKVKIYVQQKDYYKALMSVNNKNQIKDSLLTEAKNKTINELEITYQTEQRKRDIVSLQQKNRLEREANAKQKQFMGFMAVAGFFLVVLLMVLLITYRQKVKASQRVQTLMQELHHRVKNNLQILSGLFVLQIETLNDETAKAALRENESRLTSMNLIHHKLYQDQTTTAIEMKAYLTTLIHHIKESFGRPETSHIDIQIDIMPLMLEADKAVAIGLIVNELVTNSFKYAFKKKHGTITLSLQLTGKDTALLILSDNGQGWDMSTEKTQPSFGLKIVNLMAKQLDAKLESDRGSHTTYRMMINI